MSSVDGKVAVVTGAGSGIGRALATELARRGARVAISDINEGGLTETASVIEQSGATVHPRLLDVTDREAVGDYAAAVLAHFGVVHQIYNNAGIAIGSSVLDAGYELYERVLAVNLWGVIHGTKAFLPHVIASGDGHVINISSLNGYMAQGELSAYCTSKFAIRGFTETLRIEMMRERRPVKVTCVHPGGVRTNIATSGLEAAVKLGVPVTERDRARVRIYTEKLLRMDPAQAAGIVIDGVEAGRARIRVGRDAKVIDRAVRLMPVSYPRVLVTLDKLSATAWKARAPRKLG